MRQAVQKLPLYFGLMLISVILYGCANHKPIDLYARHYQPLISNKSLKKLKATKEYSKDLNAQTGLSVPQAQALDKALIHFYGCVHIGRSEFQRVYWLNFSTNHIEDPRRLAQQVGANYYITYGEYPSRTTATDSIPRSGALFYLCPQISTLPTYLQTLAR